MPVDDRKLVIEMSLRHRVSESAVRACLEALRRSGGAMAQFSHPDFGGMSQWMRGGMTMVGNMFDNGMKARLDALASDLSQRLQEAGEPIGTRSDRHSPSAQETGSAWWPGELGTPASAGRQNATRYAIFPMQRRLAIEDGGVLAVYDTGDHIIAGISQQQGADTSLRFASQHGPVRLQDLKKIA